MRLSRLNSNHHRTRGFTLIELLVAVIAGLMVAAAAVSFSKQSTRFFAQEARIAAAQMSVLAGFHRLQTDISRASFMSTPNMLRDRDIGRVCAPNHSNWPTALQQLTGLRVTVGGSPAGSLPDGKKPDSVMISGALNSIETFPVRTIVADGTGHAVYLQVNTGASTRAGISEGADLEDIFQPGSILRIRDQKNKQEFEVIASAQFPTGGSPVVKTNGPLPMMGDLTAGTATSAPCGIEGLAVGTQANVVNIVEYAIANVSGHKVYSKTIYSGAATGPGDDTRTELIRREILLDGNAPGPIEKDASAEIVAEYAVDLRFGLWVSNPGTAGLAYLAPSSSDITDRMKLQGSYTATAPTGPASVRSIEVRLVVRSREIDRARNTDQEDPVLNGGFMFRYPIPNNGGFARARTLLADVALHNQGGEAW